MLFGISFLYGIAFQYPIKSAAGPNDFSPIRLQQAYTRTRLYLPEWSPRTSWLC